LHSNAGYLTVTALVLVNNHATKCIVDTMLLFTLKAPPPPTARLRFLSTGLQRLRYLCEMQKMVICLAFTANTFKRPEPVFTDYQMTRLLWAYKHNVNAKLAWLELINLEANALGQSGLRRTLTLHFCGNLKFCFETEI